MDKGVDLHLNKRESSSARYALCKVWLKLAHWFWGRFLNFVNVFFAISLLSPLAKVLHLNEFKSSLPKMLWPSLLAQ